MEKELHSLDELRAEAAAFVRELVPGTTATLVTLSGELGAGKTAFVQAAARALGVDEPVTSPTFVLEKIYEFSPEARFSRLVHIDVYRLSSARDFAALELERHLKDPKNLIMIEWPERVADALPKAAVAITLFHRPDESRRIAYTYA